LMEVPSQRSDREPLWLPGAHSALKPVALRLGYFWGGTEPERLVLLGAFVGSFGVSVAMLVIWRLVLAPAIPLYATRSVPDKIFLSNSFVSTWPALTAPILAWTAMQQLPWDDPRLLMEAPADEYALRAVGLSCGYMLYDLLYCLYYRPMRSPLIIGHHLLPVLYWPYCALNARALAVVLFFVCTELSNFGQHLRMILLKLSLEDTHVYRFISVSWVVAFFLVRILPSPYVFFHLVNGNYAAFSPYQFWCVFFLTPLPFIFNSLWFYFLVTGVVKFLSKKTPQQQLRKAA